MIKSKQCRPTCKICFAPPPFIIMKVRIGKKISTVTKSAKRDRRQECFGQVVNVEYLDPVSSEILYPVHL